MLTRREMLKLGLLGGSSLFLPISRVKAQTGGGSPPTTPFSVSLPIPQVLSPVSTDATTDYYAMTMRTAQAEIIPGLQTTVWGYNGKFPGPTIKARSGRRVVVRQTNDLSESVSVHLHGGHTAPGSDGHATDLLPPGSARDYFYPNDQLPATLWYHDHSLDVTGKHVYQGLAGFYIVTDDYEDSLPLPKGKFEVSLVIQDRLFNSDGSLSYNVGSMMNSGFLGDRLLVNGAIQPYLLVEKRKYRFRILNGSNSRIYNLALNSNQAFVQIGSDGGLLSAPVSRNSIILAPGERVDLVIDFAGYATASKIILKNLDGTGTTADIMRFDVMARHSGKWGVDNAIIPTAFRPVDRIPAASAALTRTFTLNGGMSAGRMIFTFNSRPFDASRIDASPQLNSTEIWNFINQTNMPHPIHIHDIQWQILDINGQTPSPAELGWKDTFLVPASGQTRVIGKFTDYRGTFMFHCHNLEHEDTGMMGQLQVT